MFVIKIILNKTFYYNYIMLFSCHRINTVNELKKIPLEYGIEIDLRDNLNGEIYIAHDPFVNG